ncbi:MAG: alpha/beta superfamily hydrolase [Planctomycetota bacterium]|jgi:alpha/beta superfamily hydrolase
MKLDLKGPAGRLEALLEEPEAGPIRAAAVVCHPHPMHLGSMRNTIVFRAARALRAAGLVTLRFNFRSVEGSEGEHDGEGGEEGDVLAALDLLEERYPGSPLWTAGYSFGARTTAGLATREKRIQRVILIALPVGFYNCTFIEAVPQPGLMIFGGADEFGTATVMRDKHPHMPKGLEIVEIPGADHMFRGLTPKVEEAVHDYALENIEADSPRGPAQ